MKPFKHFFFTAPPHSPSLTVRGIGVAEAMPAAMVNRPTGTGDYLLAYFYDPVWIASSELPQQCPAGSLMVWTPGHWQCYGNRRDGFRYSWIHCDGAMVKRLLEEQRIPLDTPLPLPDATLAERHLLAICDELARQAHPDVLIVRNLLDNMLRETARALRPEAANAAIPESFLAVRQLIESEYPRKLPLRELAQKTSCSVRHFCELFRRYFGMAAHEYLLRQRLQQAAYLLRDRNLSVKEVSHRVGYSKVHSFSGLFKKQYGATPSAYRKKQ